MLQVSVEPRSRTPPLDALPDSGSGGVRADAVAGSDFLHLRSGGTPVERRKKPPSGRRSLGSNSTSRRHHARDSAPSKRGSPVPHAGILPFYAYIYITCAASSQGRLAAGPLTRVNADYGLMRAFAGCVAVILSDRSDSGVFSCTIGAFPSRAWRCFWSISQRSKMCASLGASPIRCGRCCSWRSAPRSPIATTTKTSSTGARRT